VGGAAEEDKNSWVRRKGRITNCASRGKKKGKAMDRCGGDSRRGRKGPRVVGKISLTHQSNGLGGEKVTGGN